MNKYDFAILYAKEFDIQFYENSLPHFIFCKRGICTVCCLKSNCDIVFGYYTIPNITYNELQKFKIEYPEYFL